MHTEIVDSLAVDLAQTQISGVAKIYRMGPLQSEVLTVLSVAPQTVRELAAILTNNYSRKHAAGRISNDFSVSTNLIYECLRTRNIQGCIEAPLKRGGMYSITDKGRQALTLTLESRSHIRELVSWLDWHTAGNSDFETT